MLQQHHLVVFIHGFNGAGSDFDNMEAAFLCAASANANQEGLLTLKIKSNSTLQNTLDGIENASMRIWKELMSYYNHSPLNIRAISLVGHSLGGLYARFVSRLLYDCDFFKVVEPRCFVTLASPHLSVRRPLAQSPFNLAFQTVAQRVCRSTRELCLEDDAQLLYKMTDPHYMTALAMFNKRVAYANVVHDFQVLYSTASISVRSPYANHEHRAASQDFPSITEWSLRNVQRRLIHDLPASELTFAGDRHATMLCEMFNRLNALEWERYDCMFHSLLAHEQIINKRGMFAGADVVQHLLTRVFFPEL